MDTAPPLLEIRIEEWDRGHPRSDELTTFVASQGQRDWANFAAEWHHSSHMLVALHGHDLVGFLRFVVQAIGPDAGCPPVQLDGKDLLEAKVIAFAVSPPNQGRGVGRRLQAALIQRAQAQGCYQIRSHSGGDNAANHHLKLSMGYGVHPVVRGDDKRGVYFILPLSPSGQPKASA
jgi:GNAT superfamily N-acetyltransferase